MQGFNMGRYVPPEHEGTLTGNALNRKHPLGSRASKLASHGILTVRFEMPFAVWCSSCPAPTIIGQGVRFNAEKKRIGYYHSSPIFSFRIKHAACGGEIEIQTDPKNTRYIVASGGRARDTAASEDRDDSLIKTGGSGGNFGIPTPEEKADLRESAFGKLEKTIADREKLEDARQRIGELQDSADRHWDDPYAQNQRLRKAFRVERHKREHEAARTEDLRDRMSLGIDLLPGTEEDARRAALIDFGRRIDDGEGSFGDNKDGNGAVRLDKALARPLFEVLEEKPATSRSSSAPPSKSRHDHPSSSKKKPPPSKPLLKSEIAASKVRNNLISEIAGNTRAAKDPFLDFDFRSTKEKIASPVGSVGGLLGIKRKRTAAVAELDDTPAPSPSLKPPSPPREGKRSGADSVAGNSLVPSPTSSGTHDDESKGEKETPLPASENAPGAVSSLVSYGSDSE